MDTSNYHINARQLRRLTLLETGTIGCLFVTMWSGKENGLLTVMLSIIGSLIYAGILIAIGRTDGGFYAMTERVLPGPLYRMVWLIYVVRFAVRGAWMISYLEYLIHETLYQGSRLMILIPLLIICIYAGIRNLEGRARFAELLFWWVVIPLVAIFLIGLWKTDYTVLIPDGPVDIHQIMRDDYRLMAMFLPLEFLVFRMSAIEGNNYRVWNQAMRGVLYSGLWLLLVYVVTVGILGNTWGHTDLLGVTNAMEQISIRGGGLERLDILILLFWLMGGIIALSAYFFQGQQLLLRVCSTRQVEGHFGGNLWTVLFQALLSFAVYFCFQTPQDWTDWYLSFACYVDFPLSIGIPIIIWCIYRIRRKREHAVYNHNITMEEEPVKVFRKRQTTEGKTGEKQVQNKRKHIMLSLIIIALSATAIQLTGCGNQASIEDRAYVEKLHVCLNGLEYEFRCELAYLNQDSMESIDIKADIEGAILDEEEGSYEYQAVADSIEDFDEEFYRLTGCRFDYSHLQGIYLDSNIYDPVIAGEVLEDIWEETQVVLSTPIYEENVAIGDQRGETLGEWIKATRQP